MLILSSLIIGLPNPVGYGSSRGIEVKRYLPKMFLPNEIIHYSFTNYPLKALPLLPV